MKDNNIDVIIENLFFVLPIVHKKLLKMTSRIVGVMPGCPVFTWLLWGY